MRQSHLKSAKDSLKRRITTERFTLIKFLVEFSSRCRPTASPHRSAYRRLSTAGKKFTLIELLAITRYGALHAAVMADREFLKEQIRLYLDKPTCFACCGNQVFDLFCDVMGGLPVENCSGTDYCRLDGRCLAFRFYHPNAKIGGLASCFKAAVEKLNRLQA